jgi:GNAT superfamily N-acetyltransferase
VTLLALTDAATPAGYLVATVHAPNLLTTSGAVWTGTIDELYVDDAQRGGGAGRALLSAAEAWFRERRAERLEVGAYAWNAAAIAFYEAHGFRPAVITFTRPLDHPERS